MSAHGAGPRPGDVVEQDLPGIGRRYDVPDLEGGTASIVIHHSGRRDLYLIPRRSKSPTASAAFTDAQARALGAVLSGAYFKPAVVEEIEAVIGNLLIDWVTIRPDSPAAGRSIADCEIRRRTRMTVAAILRDHTSLIAPEPTEIIEAGNRLVIVGHPADLPGFMAHVVGSEDG